MDLYTADLLVRSKMQDRERDFETNRLIALTRTPRPESGEWRERARRILGWFRVMRRGEAI